MATTVDTGRSVPLEMDGAEFRALGHEMVDRIADFLDSLPDRKVTPAEEPAIVRALLAGGGLPREGADAGPLLDEATRLLIDHSLFNGHPRFWGFITSSAAPIGSLADLLAAAVNPNLGGWLLSPIATEIEAQCIRWIAELLAFPVQCGGLLVSGGNMANLVGFWTARRAKLGWNVREDGLFGGGGKRPRAYASAETHTWIQKAADLSGLGTSSIRWIETDSELRMNTDSLRARIAEDQAAGDLPFLVVGTAGSVSTGAVDPLPEIARICREEGLWFHVDGAYGAPAACVPDASADLRGLAEADSIAVDPHKWLYAPLEAGCVLVRDATQLRDTFSFHPPYYPDEDTSEDAPLMYHEYGPQNSRGFRALKVWLALRQAGRAGYERMIADDISLARAMYDAAAAHPELEAITHALSIATFRFVPPHFDRAADGAEAYLDALNAEIVERLQAGGEAFVTHALIGGRFVLRACIVNFRTGAGDVRALVEIVARIGREVHSEMAAG